MNAAIEYDIEVIKEEALQLVKRGLVHRQEPIFTIFKHIPSREWIYFEHELENNEYLLRDRIVDLLGSEPWEED